MATQETPTPLTAQDSHSHPKEVERRFHRFPVEIPCLYSIDGGPDSNGTVVNLSRGGCAVHGTLPVKKGHYLQVRLLPDAHHPPIEVGLAPVRWATDHAFGVEFITLAPRDAKRLQGYLTFLEID
jgi:hypothetical protein